MRPIILHGDAGRATGEDVSRQFDVRGPDPGLTPGIAASPFVTADGMVRSLDLIQIPGPYALFGEDSPMHQPGGPRATEETNLEVRRQSWRGFKGPVKRILSLRVPHQILRLAVRDKPLTAKSRLPAPAHVRSVRASMAGTHFVMLDPSRCILAKELYWGKGRRPGAADQFALDVFGELARTADVVLDIGAYTGIFSLLSGAVSPTSRIHAFEVVPEVMKAAWDNVVANDLVTRVEVHLLGVGVDGDVAVMATGHGGSALPDFYSAQMRFDGGVRIPIASLDRIASTVGPWSDNTALLVKIDTEGGEAAVLANGHEALAKYRPTILCELLPGKAEIEKIEPLLLDLGYNFFSVQSSSLKQYPKLQAMDEYRDWLLTPRTAAELRSGRLAVSD